MAQLQKPRFAFMGGKLRPWDEAVLHVGCEAVLRSVNVFEGIKGYWQPDGRFGIVMLGRHYDRLRRSAKLLQMPWEQSYEEYKRAIDELICALVEPDRDMWARTTLFAVEGHWGEGTVADLVITAYHQEKRIPPPTNLGISTWQRSGDNSLPARIKAGANYQVARLARMEGRARGCQEMVLLNQWGRVAESTGACVLMVRDGVIYTPPATEGALESITLDIVEGLALSMGMKFVRRPVDRTELLIADELAICGTLAEVTLINAVEGVPLSKRSSLLDTLQTRYFEAVKGTKPDPCVELAYVPLKKRTKG